MSVFTFKHLLSRISSICSIKVPNSNKTGSMYGITSISPSGNVPTSFVLRLISRLIRSRVLLVRIRIQCSSGKYINVSVSSMLSRTLSAALDKRIPCRGHEWSLHHAHWSPLPGTHCWPDTNEHLPQDMKKEPILLDSLSAASLLNLFLFRRSDQAASVFP